MDNVTSASNEIHMRRIKICCTCHTDDDTLHPTYYVKGGPDLLCRDLADRTFDTRWATQRRFRGLGAELIEWLDTHTKGITTVTLVFGHTGDCPCYYPSPDQEALDVLAELVERSTGAFVEVEHLQSVQACPHLRAHSGEQMIDPTSRGLFQAQRRSV